MIVAHLVHADSEASSSCTVYLLEDGTGRISAREWFSEDHSRSNIDPTKGHRYVRIIGTIDKFRDGPKSIKVSVIRECPDPHEPYVHFLKCCALTLIKRTGILVSASLSSSAFVPYYYLT